MLCHILEFLVYCVLRSGVFLAYYIIIMSDSLHIQRLACKLLHDQNGLIEDELSAWENKSKGTGFYGAQFFTFQNMLYLIHQFVSCPV